MEASGIGHCKDSIQSNSIPNVVTASIDEKQSDLMKGVHEMELEQITEGYFTSRNGMDEAVVLGAASPAYTILNDGIVLSNIDDSMFANKPAIQILLNMEKGVIDILPCEKDKKTKCAMELPKNRKTKISMHGASLPDCIPCSSWIGIISINGLSNTVKSAVANPSCSVVLMML